MKPLQTSRGLPDIFFGFRASWLHRSLLLIMMHMKTTIDFNKGSSSSNTCPAFSGLKLPWDVFP